MRAVNRVKNATQRGAGRQAGGRGRDIAVWCETVIALGETAYATWWDGRLRLRVADAVL